MRKLSLLFMLMLAAVSAAPAQEWSLVVRLKPGIDDIVPARAKLEKLASDFGVLEGPVWVRKGAYLLFSDMPGNLVYKWSAEGGVSVFLPYSGYTGTDDSGVGAQLDNGHALMTLVGPIGTTVDPQGRFVYAAMGDRQIVRVEEDGRRTILASQFDGKKLNSPNDLVYRSDGSLYFTDPPSGLRGREQSPRKELPFQGVFRLQGTDLQLLIKDLPNPNGIAFSPDEKYLYVNDTRKKFIMRYEVQPDGSVTNGRVFIDMSSDKSAGVPDGMKVDLKGNVYSCGPGGLWIISPEGTHLGTIFPPSQCTNLAFGESDGKTLYLTLFGGLYRIRLEVPGIIPGPPAAGPEAASVLVPRVSAAEAILPKDVYPESLNRLPLIKREDLDETRKKVYDSIAAGRSYRRAGFQGPPGILIHSSSQGQAMTMREAGPTPSPGDRLMELGVLVVARELNSQYEWTAHEPTALQAGLDQATIDVVKFRRGVSNLGKREAAVIQLGREMFEKNKVSSDTFARALKLLGEEGLVNLVVHMDEYAGTALLLRTFDQQLRPGWKPLLPNP